MQVEIAIIGGGPAGLMAAEARSERGHAVHLFDGMPSLGRKFLMAGKSGLNLTHAEPLEDFLEKFGPERARLEPALRGFPPDATRAWAESLGTETFIGSSGRVFPKSMKAAPVLRAWLKRLRAKGIVTHVRHRWVGWNSHDQLRFETPNGEVVIAAAATILALGGASWPQLGSDGVWETILKQRGLALRPFEPANCGFNVDWSDHFKERFAGTPVKNIRLEVDGHSLPGEFVITNKGVEGGGIYQHAKQLREKASATGVAILKMDMMPNVTEEKLSSRLTGSRGSRSFATYLKKATGLTGVKAGLLRECAADDLNDPGKLAHAIKNLKLVLRSPRPINEAISTAGGLLFQELTERYMAKKAPGLFFAGEMLDWEAPTGGYLLSACFATGQEAGLAAADFLATKSVS